MARLNSKFWDVIANKYAKDPIADQAAYEKKLNITRKYMHIDTQVAEIGCGTGTTAIAHSPYVKHITASDISPKMLKIAKEKAATQNIDNISFVQAKVEDLKTENDTYDVVMAHSLLHLLKDKESVIAAVFAMLKPGGIFVSSTVCLPKQGITKFILPAGNFLGLLPLVNFLTPENILTSITDAGFEIEQHWQPKKDAAMFIVAKKPE